MHFDLNIQNPLDLFPKIEGILYVRTYIYKMYGLTNFECAPCQGAAYLAGPIPAHKRGWIGMASFTGGANRPAIVNGNLT